MPVYATFFLVITLSSIGLPLMNGFVGEFLILSGAFQARAVYGVLAASGIESVPTEVDVEPLSWPRYLAYLSSEGLPDGFLSGTDPDAFHPLGVRVAGQDVATAIAFDHDGDCGIFNMGTLEPFRRRGLATALLIRHLEDAADRGCSTASLQSTPIAEGVYLSAGFRDLGRFFEYVPGSSG
jgi:GNAT superfamily N-acetyltransferase